jgi:hypothetical protein
VIKRIHYLLSGIILFFLFASYAGAEDVSLSWDPPSTGGAVEGYTVYWSTDSGVYNDIDNVDVTGTSATISEFDTTTEYYFIVKAYNIAGEGPASNEVSWSKATTLSAPVVTGPSPTTNLTPTWSWSPVSGGNGIYRYKLDSSDLHAGASQTTDTNYTPDISLEEGSHTLYVQERDASGFWSSTGSFTVTISLASSAISTPISSTNGLTSSQNAGGGGGCFIATAAYGSPFESHVKILREFRDICLLQSKPGRAFVDLYYKYSPAIADIIAQHDWMRMMVRWGLAPLVGLVYVKLHVSAVQEAGILLMILMLVTASAVISRKIDWRHFAFLHQKSIAEED